MYDNFQALLLFNTANRFYFTRFDASNGCCILTADEKIFFTDFRYIEAAKKALPDWTVVQIAGPFASAITTELKRLGVKRAGFEEDTLSVAAFRKLEEALKEEKIKLVPASKEIMDVRSVKTDEEISKIAAAQIVGQKAFSKAIGSLKAGVSERELASEILYEMQRLGAGGASFDIIVAFGENSALPHHKTGERRLEKNDIILVDMGAKLNGYCSDMTRTFCIGDVDSRLKDIHALVLESQVMALKNIRAGMTGREADAIVREFFKANGYEKEFGHSLGHGLGIEVHEFPRLAAVSDEVLLPNMVVTVEPGLYLEGVGGVRIEDMIVIKEDGPAINLTNMDKELRDIR